MDPAPYACAPRPVAGVASTHSRPIVILSTCNNKIRSFSGARRSDNSGKKLKIGSLTPRMSPYRSRSRRRATRRSLKPTSCHAACRHQRRRSPRGARKWSQGSRQEVPLEHQLPAAGDQYGMNIGARSHEPVSHPAQRGSANELFVIDGDDRPAIVSPVWNAAALKRVRLRSQPGERCKCSSTQK